MAPQHFFTDFTRITRELNPQIAVVLGSGMSAVTASLERKAAVRFADIPGLATASVAGHRGQLVLGRWSGKAVLVFEGRLHFYEGHPWEVVTEPVRITHELGIKAMLFTNAAGGINESLQPGSLMAIRDQMEWNRPYCWREPGPGGIGGARPSPYGGRLLDLLAQSAEQLGMEMQQGVYASVTGPSYETRAEIQALKRCGADAVGMSTTREVWTAHGLGMECAGLSCITNMAAGLSGHPLSHEEVLASAAMQNQKLAELLQKFVEMMYTGDG